MDFYDIRERTVKGGVREIYPEFKILRSKDLMVRGKSFYAMWNPDTEMWTTDEYEVQKRIDNDLQKYKESLGSDLDDKIVVKYTLGFSSTSWVNFRKYMSNISDNYRQLDEKLTFADTKVTKRDYVSRRLPYSLQDGDHSAFDEIIDTLYDEEEKEKILWSIGSVVAGDSRSIQKFAVLYGDPGSGKGTVLDIIRRLFSDYCVSFSAKSLASHSDNFSTEIFRSNPLVAIDPDGNLSRIEDNTLLNTVVSHEVMAMKEKYKPVYNGRANAFLFIGTNMPVKITDAKSGIIRRLIDITPSGRAIPQSRYWTLFNQVNFELGAIAKYCLDFYRERGKHYYDGYKPINMMFKTDEFFNFVEDSYFVFKEHDGISLTNAYAMYKTYCDESGIGFKLERYKFREQLKDYFKNFEDVVRIDGKQIRSWYSGFKEDKFDRKKFKPKRDIPQAYPDLPEWLNLKKQHSLLDDILADCPAQLATKDDKPIYAWAKVKTCLKDIDTGLTHFVRVPLKLICVDFDIRNESGEKDSFLNLNEARLFPETYAEFSKGGKGVHLYYIWDGDPKQLQNVYKPGVEIKVFTGKSSLRRRVSCCNDIPVAHLSTGLPLKEEKKMLNFQAVQSERGLRELIERNLRKEIHPGTKPSIDFIDKILNDAYDSGLHYDISDMRPKIIAFANHSTHWASYCLTKVAGMKFKSEDSSNPDSNYADDRLVFFDVEVFPNLILINWKFQGSDKCERMINPSPRDVEELMKYKLVGFNCRRYDNHILYAIYLGKTVLEVYDISQKIVGGSRNAMFQEAYNISYTDVYDFCSTKQSLKKWEIALGIHHQELGLPWDQPVPEEKWAKVAEYCDNDVIATEAVFNSKEGQADWTARQILADIAGMSVNDPTNSLTGRIIFGTNRKPQSSFNYRNMGVGEGFAPETGIDIDVPYTLFDKQNRPIFPGYEYKNGKSLYRGEDVGSGGYVYAEPGIYYNVALLDIASMHPSSIVAENLFGDEYTQRFKDILDMRIAIKHKDYEKAKTLFGGKLAGYLEDDSQAAALSKALKIAINSVYGLTSATFENAFRDIRNIDNIVAKRGALFMVNLKHEVQRRGYTVAHIKTDSIKIPDADKEIIQFVMDYGKLYGYSFEHEATYDRMCLVNDAVYIAKHAKDSAEYVSKCEKAKARGEPIPTPWTATGTQFQVPYVFKTLFSHEPIGFKDLCETKTVTSALYLDMNENLADDTLLQKEYDKLKKQESTEAVESRMRAISEEIGKCHNYIFVGKAGLFCPIQKGFNGGLLMREKDGKMYAATGTKGYRWKEAEVVSSLNIQDQIDLGYFNSLAEDAKKAIEVYDDFDAFVYGETPEPELSHSAIPPWCEFCDSDMYESCLECPHWKIAEGANQLDELYYCDRLEGA